MMRKTWVLLLGVVLLFSCEKDNEAIEQEADSAFQTKSAAEASVMEDQYFGVFMSNDLELHGEIQIDLSENAKHAAQVNLLNGKQLYFRATRNLTDTDVVYFKGSSGSFALDFAATDNLRATDFLVEGKQGHVKVYPKRVGRAPAILFGVYEDSSDSAFSGAWDMITFGNNDPALFLPLIEEVIISHAPNDNIYTDNVPGGFGSFVTPGCLSVPLAGGTNVLGAVSDGVIVSAINQTSTFIGKTATWSMHAYAFTASVDPDTCNALGADVDGVWQWNGRSGTLRVVSPQWVTTPLD